MSEGMMMMEAEAGASNAIEVDCSKVASGGVVGDASTSCLSRIAMYVYCMSQLLPCQGRLVCIQTLIKLYGNYRSNKN